MGSKNVIVNVQALAFDPGQFAACSALTALILDYSQWNAKGGDIHLPATLIYLSISNVQGHGWVVHLPPSLEECRADKTNAYIAADENLPNLRYLTLGKFLSGQPYIKPQELTDILEKSPNLTALRLNNYPIPILPKKDPLYGLSESILGLLPPLDRCCLQRVMILEDLLERKPPQIRKTISPVYYFNLTTESDTKKAKFNVLTARFALDFFHEFVSLIQTTSPDTVIFRVDADLPEGMDSSKEWVWLTLRKKQCYQEGEWGNLERIPKPRRAAWYDTDVNITREFLIDFEKQIKRALNSRPLKSARHQGEEVLF